MESIHASRPVQCAIATSTMPNAYPPIVKPTDTRVVRKNDTYQRRSMGLVFAAMNWAMIFSICGLAITGFCSASCRSVVFLSFDNCSSSRDQGQGAELASGRIGRRQTFAFTRIVRDNQYQVAPGIQEITSLLFPLLGILHANPETLAGYLPY